MQLVEHFMDFFSNPELSEFIQNPGTKPVSSKKTKSVNHYLHCTYRFLNHGLDCDVESGDTFKLQRRYLRNFFGCVLPAWISLFKLAGNHQCKSTIGYVTVMLELHWLVQGTPGVLCGRVYF